MDLQGLLDLVKLRLLFFLLLLLLLPEHELPDFLFLDNYADSVSSHALVSLPVSSCWFDPQSCDIDLARPQDGCLVLRDGALIYEPQNVQVSVGWLLVALKDIFKGRI